MGRNAVPKLDAWNDGKFYHFRTAKGARVVDAANGELIVFSLIKPPDHSETLATAYADGLQEVMAAMWQAGYEKGIRAGDEAARTEIRKALGI